MLRLINPLGSTAAKFKMRKLLIRLKKVFENDAGTIFYLLQGE